MLAAARRQFLDGRRVDVLAIAGELGLSRATIYRWFGGRDGLLAEVILGEFRAMLAAVSADIHSRGAQRLLDTMDACNRLLAESSAFRTYLEQGSPAAFQLLTSSAGLVQPRIVATVEAMIRREIDEAGYQPPVEPGALAYATVRLFEAFLYTDTGSGMRSDFDLLRAVLAALLGLPTRTDA